MTASAPTIIALGGGGFSMEPENPALDVYIMKQAQVPNPRVCFLGTATGDADTYITSFYSTYSKLDCRPSHVTFFRRTPDLRATLLNQDVIFVGGGNTKSLLAVWRDWGADVVLREAWEKGIVLAGISAGAICWFEQALTDSYAGDLAVIPCLGFLAGSCTPHYNGEPDRRPSFLRYMAESRIKPGIALDDGAAAHFSGDKLHRVVRSREAAMAYAVHAREGTAHEQLLDGETLQRVRALA